MGTWYWSRYLSITIGYLVLEQIPGTQADVGYNDTEDPNDKDNDDALMHQEKGEWSHCIGGTRLAAGNSAAGLMHMVCHMMTKKVAMVRLKVIQSCQMCSS